MEPMIHGRCQSKGGIAAVLIGSRSVFVAEEVGECVRESFGLEKSIPFHLPARADNAIARAHHQRLARVDRPGTRTEFPGKAVAKAFKAGVPRFRQIEVGEQTPDGDGPTGQKRAPNAGEPAHPERGQAPGNTVRHQEIDITRCYRVPFPFSRYLRDHLKLGSFVQSSDGITVTDLDGRRFIDLTGSYGVNVFGYDFYRECMAEGHERAKQLGPVLGSLHPATAWNAERLCRISDKDEVSFHMSGTEAVMQAVRLARYHTRRHYVVRFCGAYLGWWDDVQPGPGNPMPPGKTYTLKEMDQATLRVLRTRSDIACVLVNPLQALHPNTAAAGDSTLVDSSRKAHFDRAAYSDWLRKLRQVCTDNWIVLILDEVFLGFRIAHRGAEGS